MNAAITACPLMAQLRWVIRKNLPLLANARSYQLDALRLNSPGGSQLANYDDRVMMGRAVRYRARTWPPCMASRQYD
jgi:hypothetical protein